MLSLIFEVLGDLGGDFLGYCKDFEYKNEAKGTKMEIKRHKFQQKVTRSAARAAKSAAKAAGANMLIFRWFYKGLAGHLVRGNRQQPREPEPWRGEGGKNPSPLPGFRGWI